MSNPLTLFDKMTGGVPSAGPQFTPAQVAAFMELSLPKICTEMPGLPAGMTCTLERDEDGNGWRFHVRRLAP